MAEKVENNRIEHGFYSYPDTSAAESAAAEVERIRRLEDQIDYSKPKVVHLLYDRINDSNVFATPEGFAYLRIGGCVARTGRIVEDQYLWLLQ